jgi:hypothetical protein
MDDEYPKNNVTATDMDTTYGGGGEETYTAEVVVETIEDNISTEEVKTLLRDQFRDLEDFTVTDVEIVSEDGPTKMVHGTIEVDIPTTNKRMVSNIAENSIREYIPEDYVVISSKRM